VLAIAVLANLGDWLRAAIPDGLRATFVLAIAVLANLGDWLRAAIPDGLRATFVLARPPDGLRANVPNVRGDEHDSAGPESVRSSRSLFDMRKSGARTIRPKDRWHDSTAVGQENRRIR
jgi:hypothetical protein